MALEEYRQKRRFERSPEPRGDAAARGDGHSFVIQKHKARRLHYDFRLELDGVLKSWAVTRGPSLDPRDKRLAVQVEDHPVEYGSFEGVIPPGEYGGGSVLLWDRGWWEPVGDAHEGLAKGVLKFHLHGSKLSGGWALIRLKDDRTKNWLLVKERDGEAREGVDLLTEQPLSVASGRSIEAVAEAPSDVWHAGRGAASQEPGARQAPMPERTEVQLASSVAQAPDGEGWLHEVKLDGYRVVCRIDGGLARMITRNGHDWTARFKPLAEAAGRLPCRQAILDGEVVVLDGSGVSNFAALQQVLSEERGERLVYVAFDLLYLDGVDLTAVAVERRKQMLADLLVKAFPVLRLSDHMIGRGAEVHAKACAMALEGIVSKRLGQPYRPGRGHDWVKAKCSSRQEFVIGGYTPSSAGRGALGALLLGTWQDGRLRYAGKVGTGFTVEMSGELARRLAPLRRDGSPFADPPNEKAVWTEPNLVAEVEFTEWTADGRLRHPSFQGLRADKDPTSIMRETPPRQSAPFEADSEQRLQSFPFTNPERILWADQGISKSGLAAYYAEVAPWMLPHLVGRPLSLVRCPQGEGKPCFFQRHPGSGLDKAIKTVPMADDEPVLFIDDLDGLFALVQMAVLEIHLWGCRVDAIDRPDRLCFDLDPDPDLPWPQVMDAAGEVHALLADLGLQSFLKTTGGKGLHIVVPLVPRDDWDLVKSFCKAVAERLADEKPERYVATMTKARRNGRIYIDYLRNGKGASWIAPFSTRARPAAPVSVPLSWGELTAGLRSDHFTVTTIGRRLATLDEDPWRDIGSVEQTITDKARRVLKV